MYTIWTEINGIDVFWCYCMGCYKRGLLLVFFGKNTKNYDHKKFGPFVSK